MGKSIAIIGGGNLGNAMAEGLINSNFCQPGQLTVTKRNTSTLHHLHEKGILITNDNAFAVRNAEIIIIAVKPFQVEEVIKGLRNELQPGSLLISVVTGVTISQLRDFIKKEITIFRAMPNTAIAIQQSMTCICNEHANIEQIEFVEKLFRT